jgi:hypothetical protein
VGRLKGSGSNHPLATLEHDRKAGRGAAPGPFLVGRPEFGNHPSPGTAWLAEDVSS